MATIDIDDEWIHIQLTRFEKIAGILRDQRIAVSSVTDVAVVDDPLCGMKGLRAPGLHFPGWTKIGTWRGDGRRQFVRVRRGEPAVRIDADAERYHTYLVSVDDPDATVSAIEARRARYP